MSSMRSYMDLIESALVEGLHPDTDKDEWVGPPLSGKDRDSLSAERADINAKWKAENPNEDDYMEEGFADADDDDFGRPPLSKEERDRIEAQRDKIRSEWDGMGEQLEEVKFDDMSGFANAPDDQFGRPPLSPEEKGHIRAGTRPK